MRSARFPDAKILPNDSYLYQFSARVSEWRRRADSSRNGVGAVCVRDSVDRSLACVEREALERVARTGRDGLQWFYPVCAARKDASAARCQSGVTWTSRSSSKRAGRSLLSFFRGTLFGCDG